MDAILPAGGRIDGDFARQTGVSLKALLPLSDGTILDRTIRALRDTGWVERIVLVGPDEVREHRSSAAADAVLPEEPGRPSTGPSNILRALRWLHETDGGPVAPRVLVITTDLPFLSAQTINSFIDGCSENADIYAPLVNRASFESRFPSLSREYVRLTDGEWTLGGGFVVRPEMIEANRARVEAAFAARKSQVAMARMLGLRFIWRYLRGSLDVVQIEHQCGRILGCSTVAVRSSAPELAFDIDEQRDYDYALSAILEPR